MDKVIREYHPGKWHKDLKQEIPAPECAGILGGFFDIHSYAGLDVLCDSEAMLKRYNRCLCLDGAVLRGTLLVGHFYGTFMAPASEEELNEFEKHITIRF